MAPRVALLVSCIASILTAGAPMAHGSAGSAVITRSEAVRALPSAALMSPAGGPFTRTSSEANDPGLYPCVGQFNSMLVRGKAYSARYDRRRGATDRALLQWKLTIVTLATNGEAAQTLLKLDAFEKHCPAFSKTMSNGLTVVTRRTRSFATRTGHWQGHISVDHVVQTDRSETQRVTAISAYYVHGSELVLLQQTGTEAPGSGPTQDANRKIATHLLLSRIDRILR
jgi:hypothetical protein